MGSTHGSATQPDGTGRGVQAQGAPGAAASHAQKENANSLVIRTPPGRRLARTETDHCDDALGSWRLREEGVGDDVGDVGGWVLMLVVGCESKSQSSELLSNDARYGAVSNKVGTCLPINSGREQQLAWNLVLKATARYLDG